MASRLLIHVPIPVRVLASFVPVASWWSYLGEALLPNSAHDAHRRERPRICCRGPTADRGQRSSGTSPTSTFPGYRTHRSASKRSFGRCYRSCDWHWVPQIARSRVQDQVLSDRVQALADAIVDPLSVKVSDGWFQQYGPLGPGDVSAIE